MCIYTRLNDSAGGGVWAMWIGTGEQWWWPSKFYLIHKRSVAWQSLLARRWRCSRQGSRDWIIESNPSAPKDVTAALSPLHKRIFIDRGAREPTMNKHRAFKYLLIKPRFPLILIVCSSANWVPPFYYSLFFCCCCKKRKHNFALATATANEADFVFSF